MALGAKASDSHDGDELLAGRLATEIDSKHTGTATAKEHAETEQDQRLPARIEKRHAAITRRTTVDAEPACQRAVAGLESDPRLGGLRLDPIPELLPLGSDPHSKL